jgi:RNA polymerase sigma-70 factor, ECF subfamily
MAAGEGPQGPHTALGALAAPEDGDAALARLAADRDPAAWASIYERYHQPVYRYVRARVGTAAAEDVAAEIFASAVQSIAKYSGQRPLLAWLYGIAKHRVADHHRRVRPRESVLQRLTRLGSASGGDADVASAIELIGSSVDDPGARAELLDVAPALGRLTDDQREVLVLRHFVGLTTPEIASLLNRQAAAVYSLEARALARLRKDLEKR